MVISRRWALATIFMTSAAFAAVAAVFWSERATEHAPVAKPKLRAEPTIDEDCTRDLTVTPERGLAEYGVAAIQVYESESELWLVVDIEVRVTRPHFASPQFVDYDVATHVYVIGIDGVNGRYPSQPNISANEYRTVLFKIDGAVYAYQEGEYGCPPFVFRWGTKGFKELSNREARAKLTALGANEPSHALSRLLEVAEKGDFRRITTPRIYEYADEEVVSKRLGIRVQVTREQFPNRINVESVGRPESWQETLLEVDPSGAVNQPALPR